MLIYEKPLSLCVDDFVVFTNIFYTRDYIYCIGVYYDSEVVGIKVRDTFHMTFELDDLPVDAENMYYTNGTHEKYALYRLKHNTGINQKKLVIHFELKEYRFTLDPSHYVEDSTRKLSLMTLFKWDYMLIPTYLQHYKALGVRFFSLYYNGSFAELLKKRNISVILSNISEDKDIEVRLIEWNYPWRWKKEGYKMCALGQISAMTDMLYRSKYQYEYVYYNDLDEFLFFDKKEDCTHIESLLDKYKDYDTFMLNMYWSDYCNKHTTINTKHNVNTITAENLVKEFSINNFKINEPANTNDWQNKNRTKYIIKTCAHFALNIHRPFTRYYVSDGKEVTLIHLRLNDLRLDGFYHILNLDEKMRLSFLSQ